jgi:hypothetical protein
MFGFMKNQNTVNEIQKEQESIQIDAFNTNLNGCKILCQGPFNSTKHAPIMESIEKLREPFKKKILITRTTFSFSKYLCLQYDAIFQIKDSMDWTLVLTYITYSPKPLLVVIEDTIIPDGLWAKLNSSVTLVNISQNISQLNYRIYDAIFFAPIEEPTSQYADYVFKILQQLYRTNYSQKEYREIMQELRVAGAGIAWTRHNENSNSGSIYWYDPVIQQTNDSLSNKQIGELLGWLSQQFTSKE